MENQTTNSKPINADINYDKEKLFRKLSKEEKNDEFIAIENQTFFQSVKKEFKKNKRAVFGLIVLLTVLLLAIFGPMFSPYTYDQQNMASMKAAPSSSRFAKSGDILMSVRAPVGTLNVAIEDCSIGRGLAALSSKIGSQLYLWYTLAGFKQLFNVLDGNGTPSR